MEKRKHRRFSITLQCEATDESGFQFACEAVDMSSSGMGIMIPPEAHVEVGDVFKVRFKLLTMDEAVNTEAIVRWVAYSGLTAGMSFTKGLHAKEVYALQKEAERGLR